MTIINAIVLNDEDFILITITDLQVNVITNHDTAYLIFAGMYEYYGKELWIIMKYL